MTDHVLIEGGLIADWDAASELSASTARSLTDAEIAGARFQLVARQSKADPKTGILTVTMDAIFHPPAHLRIANAELCLRLVSPSGATFTDVQPLELEDANAVTVEVERSSGAKFNVIEVGLDLGGKQTRTASFHHLPVRGFGVGTADAQWSFDENSDTGAGIKLVTPLSVSIAPGATTKADMTLRCRIVRKGAGGLIEAIRELVFGPQLGQQRTAQLTFTGPRPD